MKRFGTTLTAATVSTALFLGVVPAASAQDAEVGADTGIVDGEVAVDGPIDPTAPDAPAEGGETEETAEAPAPEAGSSNPFEGLSSNNEDPASEAPTESDAPASETEAPAEEKDGSSVGSSEEAKTYTTCEGTTATQQEDGSWILETTTGEEQTYTAEEFEQFMADDEAVRVALEEKGEECVDADQIVIEDMVLPAVLALAGAGAITYWYLNKDGSTYVKDKSRVDAEPTAEEKKASEEMLKENSDAVAEQVAEANGTTVEEVKANGTVSGERGMAAQTGSNTVARGLAALAFAAIIGAVAFVARRRFNV